MGTGFGSSVRDAAGGAAEAESRSQSWGSCGGAGIGGGGTSRAFFSLDRFLAFFAAGGGGGGGGGAAFRGAARRPVTSPFSPSFPCRKLAEEGSGSVWAFKG